MHNYIKVVFFYKPQYIKRQTDTQMPERVHRKKYANNVILTASIINTAWQLCFFTYICKFTNLSGHNYTRVCKDEKLHSLVYKYTSIPSHTLIPSLKYIAIDQCGTSPRLMSKTLVQLTN